MPADFPHTEVGITFTRATSNRGGDYGNLQITDQRSGLRIATIEMTPQQAFMFLTGCHVTVDAEILPEHLRHLIGKVMEHGGIQFPPEVVAGYQREPNERMTEFAETARIEGGWDTASWSRHTFGWQLTGRRWVERINDTADATPED